jgi:hypothetical protein
MKKTTLFRLALIALVGMAIQNASAGSAVAWGLHGHVVYSFGHPKEMAKQLALDHAHRRGWMNVKIVAATDTTGYGAIAVALHPNGHGSLLAVALGKRSAREADNIAIEQCLKAGGTDPKILRAFKG